MAHGRGLVAAMVGAFARLAGVEHFAINRSAKAFVFQISCQMLA
jgi:hypothetical protein